MDRRTERRVEALLSSGRRWGEREAREVVSAWEASGESGPVFGARFGIVPQRLWWWRSRLTSSPSFVPVEISEGSSSAPVIVTTGEGVRIEVSATSAETAAWVSAVVRGLRVETAR
jgi:hypothetical protein